VSPTRDGDVPRLAPGAPGAADVLQAATRVLAGVALRSLDVLDSAVTLPQFRLLAVLADLGLPLAMLRGFALLARTAGLLGQLAEEQRMPIANDIYMHVDRNAVSVGPDGKKRHHIGPA